MESHHKNLDHSSGFKYNTQLALHRLMHLYELIQFPLIEGFDYQSTFLDEFQSKTAEIDGKEVRIWERLDSKIIEEWTERWLLVRNSGYDAFFLDDDIGYSNFYKFRYLPIEDDFKLFLFGKGPTNENLFLDENKRNKFWQWFLSTYLGENIYPLM